METKYTLVDKQDRGKLYEGRTYGIGFGFGKKDGNQITMVMPVSACKDYLSDVVFSEITGKPYQAHGLATKFEGIFEKDRAYLVTGVLLQGNKSLIKYAKYDEDVAALEKNHKAMLGVMNHVEGLLKVEGRSEIHKLEDNRFLIILPRWWVEGTYRISLYALLFRASLYFSGDGNPIEFLKKCNDADAYTMQKALPKLDRLIAGPIPVQDMNNGCMPHSHGILGFNW